MCFCSTREAVKKRKSSSLFWNFHPFSFPTASFVCSCEIFAISLFLLVDTILEERLTADDYIIVETSLVLHRWKIEGVVVEGFTSHGAIEESQDII